MIVGQNIRKFRRLKKMTQEDLGKSINKSTRMIQKYEYNQVIPSLEVIEDLSKALNVSVDDIIKKEVIDPITRLLNKLIDYTENRRIKWSKKYLNLENKDDNIHFGGRHKTSIIEFFKQGEDLYTHTESLYLFGELNHDQYFITKITTNKYNLFSYHNSNIDDETELAYFGSSNEYPEIQELFQIAKLNSEGKLSVYDFLERAEKVESEE